MIFSSTLFLFIFLPLSVLIYFFIPRRFLGLRNAALLLCSLVFYAWGEPVVVFVMLLSIAVNYAFGLYFKPGSDVKRARFVLAAAVCFNVGLLGYYKYANFFIGNVNALFKTDYAARIALPVGISFFTFQILSYVIDVYAGRVGPQENIFKLALYVSFFPQMVAGPIIRYKDIEGQLSERAHSIGGAAAGMRRFAAGLAKKVLIANQAAVFADYVFELGNPACALAWAGVLCYAVQIYFDFSGYSDMAIGLAKIFGFTFKPNFDYPYAARSVREFWRKWHISLSAWFRDYLYIPLGGNRKGTARTYINLFVVFAVTGLWHGADWSFVVWGLFHGAFLTLERAGLGKVLDKLPGFVSRVYTLLVVTIGWVFFRADGLVNARAYMGRMFDFKSGGLSVLAANLDHITLISFAAGVVLSAPALPFIKRRVFGVSEADAAFTPFMEAVNILSCAGCFLLMVMSVVFLTGSDFNPFLYFRF